MAKKQNADQKGSKKQSGGNKGHGAGGSIKGPSCAINGRINRQQKAAKEKRLEDGRKQEGTALFKRLNEGKGTDVTDIQKGVEGKYAIPGGDQPSIHLTVKMHYVGKGADAKAFPVVQFDSVQRGHELQGASLLQNIFFQTKFIGNTNWKSNMEGGAKSTQEKLHAYLSRQVALLINCMV